ncbi:MAG: HAMP domain-containing protein [Gemmatimonadetes bacterium]|nr:HAMP domain-containing protein [Gemmatimonadota bacterium]
MANLRMQILALVTGAVLCSVALLSAFGVRSATVQFRATVQEATVGTHVAPSVVLDPLKALARDSGLAAVVARVAAGTSAGLGSDVVVVSPTGALLGSSDSSFAGATAARRGATGLSLEVRREGELRRLILDAGEWLLAPSGDTLALILQVPRAPEAANVSVSVDSASRAFGAGFNRRLWFGAAAILLLSFVAALWLVRRLLDPLARLRAAVARVATGDYTARVGATGLAELDPVARAFDEMAEHLDRSERSRRQLLRDVAHELRTPLTNLRAQLESLQDGLRTADASALASLHEEARILERLVADVDVLARADAGRLDMHRDAVDLAELVARSASAFVAAGRLPATRLHLTAQPARVTGDADRLGQVVRNLVENAVQHGGPDVVVTIRCGAAGGHAVLEVADSGPGIAPEHLPHVFDRLYRPDDSRARRTGGAGLGLSIVKAIVEGHGGTVSLACPPGAGTVVTVRLPITAA